MRRGGRQGEKEREREREREREDGEGDFIIECTTDASISASYSLTPFLVMVEMPKSPIFAHKFTSKNTLSS